MDQKSLLVYQIEKCIELGKQSSYELYTAYEDLINMMGQTFKERCLDHFFDSWADAMGHSYKNYATTAISEWAAAAQELKAWYAEGTNLTNRPLWKELNLFQET